MNQRWMLVLASLLMGSLLVAGCPSPTPTGSGTDPNSDSGDTGGSGNDGGSGNGSDNGGSSGSDNNDNGSTPGDGGSDSGDGSSNGNGSDGDGNNGGDSGNSEPTLTAEQITTVNQTAQALRQTFAALVGLRSITNPALDLTIPRLTLSAGPLNDASCPTSVAYVSNADAIQGSMIFGDLGNGCSDTVTGSRTFSGSIDFDMDRNAFTAVFNYQSDPNTESLDVTAFTFDGIGVSGTYSPSITNTADGRDMVGVLDLTLINLGEVDSADLTVTLSNTGKLTIDSASITLNTGTEISVLLANVMVDPSETGSLLPNTGSATFILGGQAFMISFDASTPTSRAVSVTLDGGSASTVTLPF